MTKNKLLELYEKFELEGLDTSFINNLKHFSDYEIYMILKSKYTYITIKLMFNENFRMLHKELKEKLINAINSAKNISIAKYTSILIEDIYVLGSGLVLELAKIISESQETYQASNALTVATNRNVLESGILAKHLTKIVSETIGEQNCFNAVQVATSKDVLTDGPSINLTKLVSEADSACKADLAASIAKNKTLLESSRSLPMIYISEILNAKTDEEARLIYSKVRKEIKRLEQQKQKYLRKQNAEYDEATFWEIYQQNPQEAISLLKENIKNNEEITPHTRVRKK